MLQKHSIALPGSVSVVHVTNLSRNAAREFLMLPAVTSALAAWVAGPYREATQFGPRRVVTPAERHPEESGAHAIPAAQHRVKQVIRELMHADSHELARKLPPVVHVVRVHDSSGTCGFAPLDARGATLVDRVVALVLADFLTRPSDFAHANLHEVTISGERSTFPDAPTLPKIPAVRRRP